MSYIRTRYPGAQPFSDNEFSRKLFFGRDQASTALTDQILANRMVVVYAKSGLGKTSLLNAGVAPRLRDDRYLPLFIRVNDVEQGPFASVLDGIRSETERQRVEYVPGAAGSLWSFFKTVEFWQGDLLLTPVLILDQFEELFTLQPEQARESFLNELSYLVRGVRPSSAPETDRTLGEAPPPLRIVLSLREDFLGFLEEASDHIPQILDHRFRLAPLNLQAAADAITGPASLEDPGLATKPFRFDGNAITDILDHLSRRKTKPMAQPTRYVEPFQLQLVCRRIEEIVAERQRGSSAEIAIGIKDIGGEAGIRETLRNFYTSSVDALPTKRVRRAARRLCEQFLISPEGRRLSLEETEIQKQLNLSPDILRFLVTRRLLRSENRSDSSYYELSHDALIEPVLATRRREALLYGWLGLGISSVGLGLVSIGVIYNIVYAIQQPITPEWVNNLLGIPFLASFGIILLALCRRNLRTLRRYRPRMPDEIADALVAGQSRVSISYSAIAILMGGYILFLAIFLGAALTRSILNAYMGNLAHADPFSAHFRQSISQMGLGLDTIAYIISVPVVMLFGARLLLLGIRRLVQAPLIVHPQPTEVSPRTFVSSGLALIAASIVLLAAVLLAGTELVKIGCAYHLQGPLPDMVRLNCFNFLDYDCQEYYRTGYPRNALFSTLPFIVALIVEATLLFARRLSIMQALLQQARS
jgi:conflict system STAND superfamily ATPase